MPCPDEQFSYFNSFWQQDDWVGNAKQHRVCEVGGAQPERGLRGPVEALREG